MIRIASLLFVAIALAAFTGCPPANPAPADGHDDHADHEEHVEGPHHGHILEFDKEGYHAEWTHSEDDNVVAIYLLDESLEKDVAIAADKVVIEVNRDGEAETFELPATNAVDGKASAFEIESQVLLVDLKATGKKEANVTATLKVEIEGETYSAGIVEEEHHHHHHH